MRQTDGFPLGDELVECMGIIRETGKFLDMEWTGSHYKVSEDTHTPQAYMFPPIFETGPHREAFGRRVLAVMEERGIDPVLDINVLVATSMPAMQFAGTFQHFRLMRHTRLMFMEQARAGENMKLGPGFAFGENEKIAVVHFAGTSFNQLRRAINGIYEWGCINNIQPCVVALIVLIDRSPEGSAWEEYFPIFKRIVAVRSPLIPYEAVEGVCSLCREGVPLIDLTGASQ
jgi:hypothetical protein